MKGQINLDSKLGKIIYNMVSMDNINIIVEIGTWNGYGSTNCIKQSIIDNNKKDYKVLSLEINEDMFNIAKKNYDDIDNFDIILGRIVDKNELNWFSETYFNGSEYKRKWLEEDINNMDKVDNVIDIIPEKIDLLILDGGEFSTYPEFKKIGNRSRIIILDDSNELKCSKIRNELLNDDNYTTLYDVPYDRNGFYIASKKNKI